MPVMRWDPFTALARLDQEFDSVVRHAFGAAAHGFVPPVEMATDGADVLITLEIPGVDTADVDIEVADRLLTVSGERKDRWADRRSDLLVREVRYGAFRRTFQLPEGVTADQVEAEADNGMLRLRLRDVTRPLPAPRKIAIRAGRSPRTIEGTAD
ncbi:Hsp20/alpha crystallin family protein [Dactylosporangium sucinum]|uniref:SHSP domain-containing protein n=1 Tax=Dactylosporangium sucinum TaxID=1424081 RepID=A0A917TP59_9ACTN|nr:Hsp20/alpha crystallin family protein [Dactylosporangium sucinum]GGM31463.1 hypothetical protein GCM10007977_035880 [Dactylosporangium sucinum]